MPTTATKTEAKLRCRRAGRFLKRRTEKEVGHLAGNYAGEIMMAQQLISPPPVEIP